MVGPIINSVGTTNISYKKPHVGLPRAMFSAVHFVNGLEIGSGVITSSGGGGGGGGARASPAVVCAPGCPPPPFRI